MAVRRNSWGMIVLATTLAVAAPRPAAATVYTVTTTDDVIAVDGEISLREALTAANTNAVSGDAPAGGAVDYINFDLAAMGGPPATINLALGQLQINTEIEITGPGCDRLTIDAGGNSRVFLIGFTSATLSGLRITGGDSSPNEGGGIVTSGDNVTIKNCCIEGNLSGSAGGGIFATGDGVLFSNTIFSGNTAIGDGGGIFLTGANATMEDCLVSENHSVTEGGGIRKAFGGSIVMVRCTVEGNTTGDNAAGLSMTGGMATMTQCLIADNTTPLGGFGVYAGMYSFNQVLRVENCTFTGNFADAGGGGLGVGGQVPIAIVNSTISGNAAGGFGGGLYAFNSDFVRVENCTISDNVCQTTNAQPGNLSNGGGLSVSSGALTLANSIVAGNIDLGAEAPDIGIFPDGTLLSHGYNIIGSLGPYAFPSNTTGDQYGDPNGTTTPNPGAIENPGPIAPLLGPLAYGSAYTPVHDLEQGSPAIDSADPATTVVRDQRGYTRPQGGGFDIGAVEKLSAESFVCNDFAVNPLEPPGSLTGWSSFGFDSALAFVDYTGALDAIRLNVTASPNLFRVAGASTNLDGWIPYANIGPTNHVRGKFWVFADGQTDPTNLNQIPNMRFRLSNRFAVNSMLEVFHHDPNEGDPGQIERQRETRPSSVPTSPSLYRVDFDPIDVTYLEVNSATEGVLRGAEAYAIYPTDEGYIGLVESCVATYPADLNSTLTAPIRVYETGTTNAGSLAAIFPAAEVSLFNLVPGVGEGSFGSVETTGPVPVYIESAAGVTLQTASVPTDRIGIAAREFNIDGSPVVDLAARPRISPERQYTIRWHLTSTQQVNQQAQVRMRARTNKFGWSQKLEIGGAWGTDAAGLYPLNANNSIAQQSLPGVGTRNPDQREVGEDGGWYTLIFQTPLHPEIRGEFAPGTPISISMPELSNQPGSGVNAPSRRDIFVGLDLVDTVSGGAGAYLESGTVTVDTIEIREHTFVAD